MKKLKFPLYVILMVITTFCTTSCGKDGGGAGVGGIAILLGDLIGFWQHDNTDSFVFENKDGQLGGTGTVDGTNGTVTNSKINNTIVTFDLVFDDGSKKSYKGTMAESKTVLFLSSDGGAPVSFNKQ